jgi:hypothetical protein
MTTLLKRIATWLVVAAVTMGVAAAVVVFAAASRDRGDVLSQEDVSRALADDNGTASQTPTTQPSAELGTAAGRQVLQSQAGLITASCADGMAQLATWVPKQGYRVDDVVRGPAAQASIWFESDQFDDVKAIVTCQNGNAVLTDQPEFDDHGGDDDDDDSRGNGRGGSSRG